MKIKELVSDIYHGKVIPQAIMPQLWNSMDIRGSKIMPPSDMFVYFYVLLLFALEMVYDLLWKNTIIYEKKVIQCTKITDTWENRTWIYNYIMCCLSNRE